VAVNAAGADVERAAEVAGGSVRLGAAVALAAVLRDTRPGDGRGDGRGSDATSFALAVGGAETGSTGRATGAIGLDTSRSSGRRAIISGAGVPLAGGGSDGRAGRSCSTRSSEVGSGGSVMFGFDAGIEIGALTRGSGMPERETPTAGTVGDAGIIRG
jgi:hypothetical protein